ncbi:hypothetical protein FRZ03_27955 [Streptomyces misionensis]|uniref:Uncharacterized protein n=1 Tax=Streptomyces misionensis TaxID=67331 RepID=A0A5C6J239_9ACTN|nr:hypothetical protein [Streptomyces misionensis]TWV34715.1 hypothetical protein FRZ03_27955 [Streptomyces misionensis]
MLDQVLTALAASGGTAVVTAAGTDAWTGLRGAVARWFGQGDVQRERAELERLEQTAVVLRDAEPAEADRVRIRQEASWQTRIEAVLESLAADEREHAAEQLRTLLAQHAPQGGAVTGPGGLAVAGNADIHAENGSIAAGVIHGGARIDNPSMPDPSQG